MRLIILAAGAALTLTACGGNKTANDSANISTDANLTTDTNMMDANMTGDTNMMGANSMDANATGGADGNMATNAATENAMKQKDLNTHDRDTNLQNGM